MHNADSITCMQGNDSNQELMETDDIVVDKDQSDKPLWVKTLVKKKTKKPEARCGHVAFSHEGVGVSQLYTVGGYSTAAFDDCWRCSFPTLGSVSSFPKWQPVRVAALPSPFPRTMYRGCVAYDPKLELFLAFGTDGSRMFNDVWSLDVQQLQWTCILNPTAKTAFSCPTSRCNHAMAILGPSLIIHGGESDAGLLGDLWIFDRPTGTWEVPVVSAGCSPQPRCSHMVATVSGRNTLAIFGGCGMIPNTDKMEKEGDNDEDQDDSIVPLNDLWLLQKDQNTGTFLWSEVNCEFGPSPRSLGSLISLRATGDLLLFGGFGLREVIKEEKEDEEEEDVYKGQCNMVNNEEESAEDIEMAYLGDSWIFNLEKGSWIELEESAPRNGHSVVEFENFLVCWGGFDGEEFDNELHSLPSSQLAALLGCESLDEEKHISDADVLNTYPEENMQSRCDPSLNFDSIKFEELTIKSSNQKLML